MALFSNDNFGPTPPPSFVPPPSFKFRENAPWEKGFESYFEDTIKPALRELDKTRQESEIALKHGKSLGWKILVGCIIGGLCSPTIS